MRRLTFLQADAPRNDTAGSDREGSTILTLTLSSACGKKGHLSIIPWLEAIESCEHCSLLLFWRPERPLASPGMYVRQIRECVRVYCLALTVIRFLLVNYPH